jgi:hypothetical protein
MTTLSPSPAIDPVPAPVPASVPAPFSIQANLLPAHRALNTAAALRRLGCQVLDCHAINGQPWLRARLPRVDDATRRRILAAAWQAPAAVVWGTR